METTLRPTQGGNYGEKVLRGDLHGPPAHESKCRGQFFYEGKDYVRKRSKSGSDESIKLTKKAKQALEKFFFGEQGFIRDNFGREAGFAFELREARRRLREGESPSSFYPMRIYPKGDRVSENSGKNCGQNEEEISQIVDKRIRKILAEQGLLNSGC